MRFLRPLQDLSLEHLFVSHSIDGRLELLDVVHHRYLAEPDEELSEHAGSAFRWHVFVQSGRDISHEGILPAWSQHNLQLDLAATNPGLSVYPPCTSLG